MDSRITKSEAEWWARREIERLREENRQLRGTSTPEIEANISRLAFQLGVTLAHLPKVGGRELEALLQRLEATEIRAAVRAALEGWAMSDIHERKVRYLQDDGMEPFGVVMQRPTPAGWDIAIVADAAVRRLSEQEFRDLMHPSEGGR